MMSEKEKKKSGATWADVVIGCVITFLLTASVTLILVDDEDPTNWKNLARNGGVEVTELKRDYRLVEYFHGLDSAYTEVNVEQPSGESWEKLR